MHPAATRPSIRTRSPSSANTFRPEGTARRPGVPGRRWVRGRLLENVGKLNMMLRRENACCLGRNRNRGQGAPTRGNRGRGTDSSNRVPSSGESANYRSPTALKWPRGPSERAILLGFLFAAIVFPSLDILEMVLLAAILAPTDVALGKPFRIASKYSSASARNSSSVRS